MFIGIDYGTKLSGNTVICYTREESKINILRSVKGGDADKFILDTLKKLKASEAFIDAPLSLPGVYCGLLDCTDFFYREADRITKAMSPMFLGGLTARAMKLKFDALRNGTHLMETYPGYLAKHWKLNEFGYKTSKSRISDVGRRIKELAGFISDELRSWHDIDALLAMISHTRHMKNESLRFGKEGEGFIYV